MDSMSVYGEALRAYESGDRDAVLVLERDDGFRSEVPVAVFFRQRDEWSPLDIEALDTCRGRILDVGAGAGIHSLWLQEHEYDVTAIDVAAGAVDIMRCYGLRDARRVDIFDLVDEPFDTIVLLGRNAGIAGDLAGLDRLLAHLRTLVAAGGQILLTSLDVDRCDDLSHRAYAQANAAAGRYRGEVRFRERFGDLIGPLVPWLYVDPASLEESAARQGLSALVLHAQPDGNYLAQLTIR